MNVTQTIRFLYSSLIILYIRDSGNGITVQYTN